MFWKLNSINDAVFEKEKELQFEFQQQQQEAERRERKLRDELAGLKPFLNTHDDADSSELTLALDTVNDLLHDFASALSDDADAWSSFPQGDSTSHRQLQENLRLCIPLQLLDAMSTCKPSTSPRQSTNLLQYGIHATFLQTVWVLMGKFCYGLGADLDREMHGLAEETLEREIQPVYGRWRSITHQSIRLRHHSLQMEQQAEFIKHLSQEIGYGITSAACLIFQRSISKEHYHSFYSPKEADIIEILGRVVTLCIIVRERVISRDYLPYLAIGEKFNHHLHEPSFPVRGKLQDDEIVCCIKLGLTWRAKRGRENGKVELTLGKKPQVITRSMLADILSEDSNVIHRTRPKPSAGSPKQSTATRTRSSSRGGKETSTRDSQPTSDSAGQTIGHSTTPPSPAPPAILGSRGSHSKDNSPGHE